MKILVTGASGFLGQCLIKPLMDSEGQIIRVLVHRSAMNIGGCEAVRGDLNDPESLLRVTQGMDTVVHLAALTHTNREEDYYKINTEGTKNLLHACARNGVTRFVYVSSRAAHYQGGGYARSKLLAEDAVKGSKLFWVILRPAEVYGEGSPDAINRLIQWIRKYKIVPVIGNGQYKLSPVFIDDIIPPMVRAILNEDIYSITLNLAGPENITFTTLVDRLCDLLKVQRYKIFIPVPLAQQIFNVMTLMNKYGLTRDQIPRLLCEKSADISNTTKLLNYDPRRLEEGLAPLLDQPGKL